MIRRVKWAKDFLTRIQGQGEPFITWGSHSTNGGVSYDIFQGEQPVDLNVNFGAQYVFGTRFDVASGTGGQVLGIKAHSSQAGMISTVALYKNDGTLLDSKIVTDPGGGYNTYLFDTPVDVPGSSSYVAAVLTAGNFADRTAGGYFNNNFVTNDRLTAPAWISTDRNGRALQSAVLAFPSSGPSPSTASEWYMGLDVSFLNT